MRGTGQRLLGRRFSAGLPTGRYLLVLSQDDNNADTTIPITAATAAAAFSKSSTGLPHDTAVYLGSGATVSERFVQPDATLRTGRWAPDIDVAGAVTQVPEPGTSLLWPGGLAALRAGTSRKRRQQQAAATAQATA